MPGASANLGLPYPTLGDSADIESHGVKPLADAVDALVVNALAAYQPPMLRASGAFDPTSAGTYLIRADNTPYANAALEVAANGHPMHVALAAAYAISGRTTKLRVRAWVMANATAPAANFTFGLHPITAAAGAAGNMTVTLGTAITGSTVAINAPAASALTPGTGTDFNYSLLTDGVGYMLCVTTSAQAAANSRQSIGAILERRHT